MEGIVGMIITIGILVLILLVCRQIVAWYLKIDRRIDLMEENNRLLKELLERMR